MKLVVGLLLILFGAGAFWGLRQRPALSQMNNKTSVAPGAQAGPVIVELFTSEGCSSCPPADVLLSKLDQQSIDGVEIIGLSEHVDYWDDLGWRDPFSSAEFSKRQSAYSNTFRTNSVYTPQMIVDGQEEFVGSDEKRARAAIAKAASKAKARIEVTPSINAEGQAVSLSINVSDLPSINNGDTAEVLMAVTESKLSSEVPRGENAGRSLKHTAVVRYLESVGEVDSGTSKFTADKTVSLATNWQRNNLRLVIFIQERRTRRVLGAASVKL